MRKYLVCALVGLFLAVALMACTPGTPEPNDFPPRPPTATPDPLAATATPDPRIAPPLRDILRDIRAIKTQQDEAGADELQTLLAAYTSGLVGQTVPLQDGWIAQIGPVAQGAAPVQVDLEDPVAVPGDERALATLDGVPGTLVPFLHVGEQVHFSGTIARIDGGDAQTELSLELTDVRIDPLGTPAP